MKTGVVLMALFCAVAVKAKEPEFAGYALLPDGAIFSLHESEKNQFSPWLKIGQEWRNCKIVRFDRQRELLVVKQGDVELVLFLRDARIGETPPIPVLPGLVKGSFELLDGAVVYSEDAEVKVAELSVSAVAGVMVSDVQQKHVVGDLKISSDSLDMLVEDGRIRNENGEVSIEAKSLTVGESTLKSELILIKVKKDPSN